MLLCIVLAACAGGPVARDDGGPHAGDLNRSLDPVRFANRITWGADTATVRRVVQIGPQAYMEQQLHAQPNAPLPPEAQARIAAMTITQTPVAELARQMEQRNKDANAIADDEQKKAAQQAYQQEMNRLGREAATRDLLRALYSHAQLQEQMNWFWFNHFNVHLYKSNIRVLLGDYQDTLRAHALGHFRDMLRATVFHPAMLRYLDNEQNAAGHINENYARELMELHTLGVDGGYSQKDVQELARILTGVGVRIDTSMPGVKRELQAQYVRNGLFEFNPNRHDYGDKTFLGQTVKGRGLAEVDEAIDRLARHPATARFISRKLAIYFVADEPPKGLVDRMSRSFSQSDGDIAVVLRTMFDSPEFAASLGRKFKDPMHYVVSSIRAAYDGRVIVNATPAINWLNRMGEPLYGRQTPDGYAMTEAAWASPGQMATRFEIAKSLGGGSAGLFRPEASGPDDKPQDRPAFPQLSNALYYEHLQKGLGQPTRTALDQATSPQEWNTFFLSSPEMMNR
ncbi:MAG: hypothetical protein JWN73_127 [Betaproteobacteria bacterium]|nr:hypothetical protein [Betaproteobacteria bacterium]